MTFDDSAPPVAVRATDALCAGLKFLEAIQAADGSFPSYNWRVEGEHEVDLALEQAVFPTVFIGSVLLAVPGAETIVRRVTRFAETHREPEGVWSYLTYRSPSFDAVIPDVDDTALAALLLRDAGRDVAASDAVLLSNRDRRGRFYTWITVLGAWWNAPARLRIVLRRLPHLRRVYTAFNYHHQRIRDLDAGVNANVVLHLGRRPGSDRAFDHLIEVARCGEVADRWYQDAFMLWYLISRALRRHGIEEGAVLVTHIDSRRPTTPLQTAQAVCITLDWVDQVPEAWIAALTAAQSSDGSWERTPLYSARDHRWGGEATTTALCVEALARWLGSTTAAPAAAVARPAGHGLSVMQPDAVRRRGRP